MLNKTIAFAGTPLFAAIHLEALLKASIRISAVFTRPDKPAGRGKHLQPSPVKQLALKYKLPLFQPRTLKDEAAANLLSSLKLDLVIDVAYGLIIPKNILSIPRLGFLNIHPSLLPRWRGPAPIPHAILAGDTQTGISLIQLDEGIDTGPIIAQESCLIETRETAASLHDRLAALGSSLLVASLRRIDKEEHLISIPQLQNGVCYAPKLEKSQAYLDWRESAIKLDRTIRAFNPWPIAFSVLNGETIRIVSAIPVANSTQQKLVPGYILNASDQGIDVATGQGILRLLSLQLPGRKVLSAKDILNGKKDLFSIGSCFSTASNY